MVFLMNKAAYFGFRSKTRNIENRVELFHQIYSLRYLSLP